VTTTDLTKSTTSPPIPPWLKALFRRSLARRFALRLTVEGWCLVTTMLLVGLAALNTGAPLLYLLFSIMCAFFVFSAVLATNTIKGIWVEREMPQTWMAGLPLPVTLKLRNRKFFTPSFSLRVHDHLFGGEVVGSAFADRVPPRNHDHRQTYEALFLQRGVYEFDTIEVATRFPFGLIDRQLHFKCPERLLVLPQVIPMDRVMATARTELGEQESRMKGAGSGLYGFRQYTAEMSAKDIHWKISARRGELMVREYESEERRRASVVLDNRHEAELLPGALVDSFERAVVLTASVIDWLVKHGHEVELRTASGVVGFGGGSAHITRCLRALAFLELLPPTASPGHSLWSPDPTVVTIPILSKGRMARSEGVFPLSVEDFTRELAEAFQPPRTHDASREAGEGDKS
jgi:uncharacterized protein (DUF58 family)